MKAFGAKMSKNGQFQQTARYGTTVPTTGTTVPGQRWPALSCSTTSPEAILMIWRLARPCQVNARPCSPKSVKDQFVSRIILAIFAHFTMKHDRANGWHGRALRKHLSGILPKMANKQVNNQKRPSDTYQARPCQKVAWSCQTPSSINTWFKLIWRGVGAFWWRILSRICLGSLEEWRGSLEEEFYTWRSTQLPFIYP